MDQYETKIKELKAEIKSIKKEKEKKKIDISENWKDYLDLIFEFVDKAELLNYLNSLIQGVDDLNVEEISAADDSQLNGYIGDITDEPSVEHLPYYE